MSTSSTETREAATYRDMLQKLKQCQVSLDKLQDQAVDLQLKFANAHFQAAQLFDPDITAIVIEAGPKSPPRVEPDSTEESRAEELDDKYYKMCQEVLTPSKSFAN